MGSSAMRSSAAARSAFTWRRSIYASTRRCMKRRCRSSSGAAALRDTKRSTKKGACSSSPASSSARTSALRAIGAGSRPGRASSCRRSAASGARVAIRAQPREAMRGRLRVTEQGETISARYGRPEIARRDLEQMVQAVLLGSLAVGEKQIADGEERSREGILDRAAKSAKAAYESLISDRAHLARYTVAATPIHEVAALPLASRPAARRPGLDFAELRAIPWVFSWNQSRHGIPGGYG